jgi:hypothetical protein
MKKRIIILFVFISFIKIIVAQNCSNCTYTSTTLDSANYILTSGQLLCIDSTSNFIGTITLNGGSVCNKGLFSPKQLIFNSGSITNYSNVSLTNSHLALAINCTITSHDGSVFNLSNGNLILNGGTFSNYGVLSIIGNLQNISGTLVNQNLINCNVITGSNTLVNTGTINTN